jgi:glucosamine 6-phosphate synthetase-like amidotransferase/phosphosugar isomerase protein
MCGIVAYLGEKEAYPILINGLRRLEYRGYDSAGVALLQGDQLTIYKCQGKVSDLEAHINGRSTKATLGIGHTRWATHGPPNDVNAHPHQGTSGPESRPDPQRDHRELRTHQGRARPSRSCVPAAIRTPKCSYT